MQWLKYRAQSVLFSAIVRYMVWRDLDYFYVPGWGSVVRTRGRTVN
jgi:hypothetical protein